MSGPPRVRSMNIAVEPEARPVLGPAGNKAPQKPAATKTLKKPSQQQREEEEEEQESKDKKVKSAVAVTESVKCSSNVASIMKQDAVNRRKNVSMNRSWSSDASSSDSSHSLASWSGPRLVPPRRKLREVNVKVEKVENVDDVDCLQGKKRCGWVTPNTDSCYAAFHDEEWGVPVHDDKKLFELLSLSGALAELTWPAILNKRHIFREVFLDFDPIAVSKLNEKKMTTSGSPASFLLSELKLRSIIENGRHICKVIDEFGSFDKYIWNFLNNKAIVSQFRYPRQVPVKTPKAEVISKDLVRRGFRSVGPTVIYSFMQVAGLTNDHLTTCFRFQDCIISGEGKAEKKKLEDVTDLGLARAINDLSLYSK